MNDQSLLQQALKALELLVNRPTEEALDYADNAIDALRERLAQPEQEPVSLKLNDGRLTPYPGGSIGVGKPAEPEQEPVAWADMDVRGEDKGLSWTPGHFHKTPLYTTPPQRKPLPPQSPCEMTQAEGKMFKLGWLECEAAHGIKGEA